MAPIQEVNLPEENEVDPRLETEKKTAPSQTLKIKAVAGQEKSTAAVVQLVKRESWPNEPKTISDEVKIQKLEELSLSQSEEITNLQRQIEMFAQAQNGADELQNEAVKLLSAAFKLQNEVVALQSENAELEDTNLKQQFAIQLSKAIIKKMSNGISSMAVKYEQKKAVLQNEVSKCKLSLNEYKLELEEATAKLEKKEKHNQSLFRRCRTMKAASYKKGEIVQANKEKKAEMRKIIDILKEENEELKNKLNTGFIGRYRSVKRFFVRVAYALLFRTAH